MSTITATPAFLVRNLKTEVVHKPGCPFAGVHAATWNWAGDKDMAEVMAATIRHPWLHLCRHCLPRKCRCRRCRS